MLRQTGIATTTQNHVLDIPAAAQLAGFTTRHFRRIIQEDRIPMVTIHYKSFITARDFARWNETHGERRLHAAIHQVDLWTKGLGPLGTSPDEERPEELRRDESV